MTSSSIMALHFLREDMTAGEGNEPAWVVGDSRTLPAHRTIIPCTYGYHGSPTLWAALKYAPGPIACLVELDGDVVEHGNPVDKYAARTRKLIAAVNISRELRLFAADCAEHVLPIYEREYPNDARPRNAIQAARDYAEGRIDAAARDAACAAARDAERDAERAAAWAASAAWAAIAASATSRHSRPTQASVVIALAAASCAAHRVAIAAERAWQQERFNSYFANLFERETYSRDADAIAERQHQHQHQSPKLVGGFEWMHSAAGINLDEMDDETYTNT